MKITFEKTEAEATLYVQMTSALANAMNRTTSHIDKMNRKRSVPEPLKALYIQKYRAEYGAMKELREQLQLAWRLAK